VSRSTTFSRAALEAVKARVRTNACNGSRRLDINLFGGEMSSPAIMLAA
jgi:hypothetical protein